MYRRLKPSDVVRDLEVDKPRCCLGLPARLPELSALNAEQRDRADDSTSQAAKQVSRSPASHELRAWTVGSTSAV
jgi:hypothetical protein